MERSVQMRRISAVNSLQVEVKMEPSYFIRSMLLTLFLEQSELKVEEHQKGCQQHFAR
jgi:hypothetical protein